MFIPTGKAPVRLAWRPISSTFGNEEKEGPRWTDDRANGAATHSPVAQFAAPISYVGGRYDTAPFASRSRPPNGANFINQLFGASGAVAFLAV
jgi:hypothetical protein